MNKPGTFAKIVALLGIVCYVIADLFVVLFFDTILSEAVDWEQGLGQLITIALSIVYIVIFAGLGSLLVIIGQIHRQVKLLVILSTLAFLPVIGIFTYVTIVSFSMDSIVGFAIIWAILAVTLIQHLRGWQAQ